MLRRPGGTRLLLLGVSARALARSAAASRPARASWPGGLIVLDYFGDADLRGARARPPIRILSLTRDLDLPRSIRSLGLAALDLSWEAVAFSGGLENRPAILGRLAARGSLLGNGAETVRRVRDPRVLFPFLSRASIPHAPTAPRARRAPREPGARYVWKAARSGSGRQVREARPGEPRPRGHYLQRFVRGPVLSAAFVAARGRAAILGVSEQIVGFGALGGGGYRYGGNIVGTAADLLPPRALDRIRSIAGALAGEFGLAGLNGIDFVLDGGEPRLIEVNPRYTASMEVLEDLSGRNLFDLHLDAVLSGRLPEGPLAPRRGAPPYVAKGILYARREVRACDPGILRSLGCRDRPLAAERIARGQPICTLIVAGRSPAACRRELASRASLVRRALSSRAPAGRPLPAHAGSW